MNERKKKHTVPIKSYKLILTSPLRSRAYYIQSWLLPSLSRVHPALACQFPLPLAVLSSCLPNRWHALHPVNPSLFWENLLSADQEPRRIKKDSEIFRMMLDGGFMIMDIDVWWCLRWSQLNSQMNLWELYKVACLPSDAIWDHEPNWNRISQAISPPKGQRCRLWFLPPGYSFLSEPPRL